jgi:hypothetical protein
MKIADVYRMFAHSLIYDLIVTFLGYYCCRSVAALVSENFIGELVERLQNGRGEQLRSSLYRRCP